MNVRVQQEDFDISAEMAAMRNGNPKIGAIASFVGVVRDVNDGDSVATMTLEHYPGMTEKAIVEIIGQARGRWEVLDALVIHRIGTLKPTDQIVLVIVASTHRGDAFAACEFIMDYLKTQAPFWKKEVTPQGSRWVDARVTDDKAAQRSLVFPATTSPASGAERILRVNRRGAPRRNGAARCSNKQRQRPECQRLAHVILRSAILVPPQPIAALGQIERCHKVTQLRHRQGDRHRFAPAIG